MVVSFMNEPPSVQHFQFVPTFQSDDESRLDFDRETQVGVILEADFREIWNQSPTISALDPISLPQDDAQRCEIGRHLASYALGLSLRAEHLKQQIVDLQQ